MCVCVFLWRMCLCIYAVYTHIHREGEGERAMTASHIGYKSLWANRGRVIDQTAINGWRKNRAYMFQRAQFLEQSLTSQKLAVKVIKRWREDVNLYLLSRLTAPDKGSEHEWYQTELTKKAPPYPLNLPLHSNRFKSQ